LKHGPQDAKLPHIVDAEGADRRPAMPDDLDEPLCLEHRQRLSDRRPADAQPLSNVLLDQPLPRTVNPAKDELPELLVHLGAAHPFAAARRATRRPRVSPPVVPVSLVVYNHPNEHLHHCQEATSGSPAPSASNYRLCARCCTGICPPAGQSP